MFISPITKALFWFVGFGTPGLHSGKRCDRRQLGLLQETNHRSLLSCFARVHCRSPDLSEHHRAGLTQAQRF